MAINGFQAVIPPRKARTGNNIPLLAETMGFRNVSDEIGSGMSKRDSLGGFIDSFSVAGLERKLKNKHHKRQMERRFQKEKLRFELHNQLTFHWVPNR